MLMQWLGKFVFGGLWLGSLHRAVSCNFLMPWNFGQLRRKFGHNGSSTSRILARWERNWPWPVRTYIVWLMIALWQILVKSPPLGRVVFWSHFGRYPVRYAVNVSSKEQFTMCLVMIRAPILHGVQYHGNLGVTWIFFLRSWTEASRWQINVWNRRW